MKNINVKTLTALGYGAALAMLKGGTIIQSAYSKQGFVSFIVPTVGLSLSGLFVSKQYNQLIKTSYQVTTVVKALYQTWMNFGGYHTKYIAPKYKKFDYKKENPAYNKPYNKVYVLDAMASLFYKAVDITATIYLPSIVADQAVSSLDGLVSKDPLESIFMSYGVIIAGLDSMTNNPAYSYAIKTAGLFVPAMFCSMLDMSTYTNKMGKAYKLTTVVKSSYTIYKAMHELQQPGLDRYKKHYYQTEVDKLSMFKGMSKIKDILTAEKLHQLEHLSKISLASMNLVSISAPMLADKIVETIWNKVDSAITFSLFCLRAEYSPIVAGIFIASGSLLALNDGGKISSPNSIVLNPAYLIIPIANIAMPTFNFNQLKNSYKAVIWLKAGYSLIEAVDHFNQAGVIYGNQTFEQVVKNEQIIAGVNLTANAVADVAFKDYFFFSVNSAIMNFIGVSEGYSESHID